MAGFWNNKKVVIYIALLHHTRFLIPIADGLEKLGAKVQFIVGQAERSQEITAVECGLKYNHVFDYITEDDNDEIQLNYLKERQVFGDALLKDSALGAQMITVMDKTLYSTAQEYIGFRNLLIKENPDVCFALHEVNRWGKMISFWAKKMNIPFLTLQEGLGYGFNFGYMGHIQYSTMDLMWGERIRKKLSDFEAPIERIIPVGNTHIAKEKEGQKKKNVRKKMRKKFKCNGKFVNLLIFSASPLSVQDILPILEVSVSDPDIQLVIKFHPATKYEKITNWKDSIPKKLIKGLNFIHGEESIYDLFALCDLCTIAQPSTTGLEALALDKPLVQLSDVKVELKEPYSFVEQKVATEMTPLGLAKAMSEKIDFSKLIKPEILEQYLKNELTDTIGAKDRVIKIAEKIIKANKSNIKNFITPLDNRKKDLDKCQWSIVVPVPVNSANEFLFQLESIAANSEGSGKYEIIFLTPETLSPNISEILSSLEGNIQHIQYNKKSNMFTEMNKAATKAMGENIVFLSRFLSPDKNWLDVIDKAFKKYSDKKIFGGKITNKFNNIVHGGMVLNVNNAPVSAYLHLDSDFPAANKERSFQMLDYSISLKTNFFLKLGGFWPKTGRNAFMDICLRGKEETRDKNIAVYLPKLHFFRPDVEKPETNHDDSINFYGKWHGTLWDSEKKLYDKDGISNVQLDAARLTRAMKITGQ